VQIGGTLRADTDIGSYDLGYPGHRLQASHKAGPLCAQAALAGTARQIVDQGGDCAVALKGNQGDDARYVNNGTDSLRGTHAVIGAEVTGSGTFQVSSEQVSRPPI
jgi:hypothetical protein